MQLPAEPYNAQVAEQARIVQLNHNRLRERIMELGLKQWAVARQTGVARRTVIRWLSGEVSRITVDNLQNLARVVNLSPGELSTELPMDRAASSEEQQRAARTMLSHDTGELFLRSQSYQAYESMLNALRHPGLSMDQLADIYLHMMAAAAMQHEFARAREHGHQCIACAERCQNRQIEFTARINLAVISSETGQVSVMRSELENLLAMMESQGFRKSYGALCINLSRACQLMAELARATHFAVEAVRTYSQSRDHVSYAEALVLAALACSDLGSSQLALQYLVSARKLAEEKNLPSWIPAIRLREMEARAALGEAQDAALSLSVLDRYDELVYIPIDCYLAAVRVLQAAAEPHIAVQVLNRGMARKWIRPQEKAMLLLELALIRQRAGNLEHFAQPALEASRIFADCGMQVRAEAAQRFAEGGEEPRLHSNSGLLAMLQEGLPGQ